MPVRESGLGLLNPVTSSKERYLRSTRGSAELIQAVTGGGKFSNANHIQTLSDERRYKKKAQDVPYESILKGLVRDIKGTDKRLLLRAKNTGACPSVRGTTVSGTVLSAKEIWYFYALVITSLS